MRVHIKEPFHMIKGLYNHLTTSNATQLSQMIKVAIWDEMMETLASPMPFLPKDK